MDGWIDKISQRRKVEWRRLPNENFHPISNPLLSAYSESL